jgi:uracil-DNA glycosylase
MNQKQIFTEYWNVLNDFEDFMDDRFRRERNAAPHFKVSIKQALPSDPALCTACSLHEHNELRSPVSGEGERPLLIINRALPGILAERGDHFTIPEEDSVSKWLEAIGLNLKKDCVIAPLLFCPVKDPIHPAFESVQACFPFIERLIEKTNPKAILVLGPEGEEYFSKITSMPVFATHHPSDVLIDQSLKRPVWEVLKRIKGAVFGN